MLRHHYLTCAYDYVVAWRPEGADVIYEVVFIENSATAKGQTDHRLMLLPADTFGMRVATTSAAK